jgi:hypothetical protein
VTETAPYREAAEWAEREVYLPRGSSTLLQGVSAAAFGRNLIEHSHPTAAGQEAVDGPGQILSTVKSLLVDTALPVDR